MKRLSFSLSSKPSASRPSNGQPPNAFHSAGDADGAAAKPEYFTEFDPSAPLPAANSSNPLIPPIPNNPNLLARYGKRAKTLSLPSDADLAEVDPSNSQTRFVLDSSTPDPAAASVAYGLTVRTNPHRDEEEGRGRSSEDLIMRRYKDDMETVPDDRGFEEFEDIAVEDFAVALLSGYGWTEGKGIGRNNSKGDSKVVQYNRRAGTDGLGYVPDPSTTNHKRHHAPPEAAPEAKDKHEERDEERIVRVVSGKHTGCRGRIVEKLRDKMVSLKLVDSGEKVRVGVEMLAELGSSEEEKCLRKFKEDRRSKYREERHSSESRSAERRSSHRKITSGSSAGERETVCWLQSHIRVRVISKDFKGGRFYLKKGKVVDVVGPMKCDVSMDDGGELIQCVDQEILETALPKCGGSVLVLYGKHKGVYGSLEERNSEKETGVVKDADTHAFINVCLEQIAEYIGDPSYLGY